MPSRISLASLALGLAAVTGGIAVAYLDAHTDEVSVTLAALIILLGSVGPPWRAPMLELGWAGRCAGRLRNKATMCFRINRSKN
jgi:hypothetical protein